MDKNKKHDIDIVIDRHVISKTLNNRLADNIGVFSISKGLVYVYDVEKKNLEVFSSNFSSSFKFSLEEIEQNFFNSPQETANIVMV